MNEISAGAFVYLLRQYIRLAMFTDQRAVVKPRNGTARKAGAWLVQCPPANTGGLFICCLCCEGKRLCLHDGSPLFLLTPV